MLVCNQYWNIYFANCTSVAMVSIKVFFIYQYALNIQNVAVLFIAFISRHKDPFHLLILSIIIERWIYFCSIKFLFIFLFIKREILINIIGSIIFFLCEIHILNKHLGNTCNFFNKSKLIEFVLYKFFSCHAL